MLYSLSITARRAGTFRQSTIQWLPFTQEVELRTYRYLVLLDPPLHTLNSTLCAEF